MYDHKRDRCRRGMVQRTRIFPTQKIHQPEVPNDSTAWFWRVSIYCFNMFQPTKILRFSFTLSFHPLESQLWGVHWVHLESHNFPRNLTFCGIFGSDQPTGRNKDSTYISEFQKCPINTQIFSRFLPNICSTVSWIPTNQHPGTKNQNAFKIGVKLSKSIFALRFDAKITEKEMVETIQKNV